jgi:hypothetical protein
MQLTILLIASLLSWAAYDTNLFSRRRDSYSLTAIEVSLEELNHEQEQQQEKVLRQRRDVIPKWRRDIRKPMASRCNYFSTKPRDARFSDQRKIRRMFNNL